MEDGIVIGPESQQKDTKDFNLRTEHVGEEGKIMNTPEGGAEDMAAFVLFATNVDETRRIGLAYETQEPINKKIIKAFTFDVPHDFDGDIRSLVTDEAMLQAGFEISNEQIEYLGKSYMGNKTGCFCHQFGITVDKRTQQRKTSTDPKAMDTSHFWAMNEEIQHIQDWIAQITCIKRYTSKMNSITISSSGQKQ
jgi:hypothetical protein